MIYWSSSQLSLRMLLLLFLCLGVSGTSGTLLGGKTEYIAGQERPEVAFGLNQLSRFYASKGKNDIISPKILYSTKQMVSGTRYDYIMAVTGSDNSVELCDVSVWVQPWVGDGGPKLTKPISCGLSRSGQASLEKEANRLSNGLMFAVLKGTPNLDIEGDHFKLSNALMYDTNCTKSEGKKLVGKASFKKQCNTAENATPVAKCSATLHVSEIGLEARDVVCTSPQA